MYTAKDKITFMSVSGRNCVFCGKRYSDLFDYDGQRILLGPLGDVIYDRDYNE